jgi:hypothetical protein
MPLAEAGSADRASYIAASIPAMVNAVAATGPAIPPPITSAVRGVVMIPPALD